MNLRDSEPMTNEAGRTVADWRQRGALSISEAAGVLGIGRTLAFDLVRRGELQTVALGARRVVAVSTLRRMLGED